MTTTDHTRLLGGAVRTSTRPRGFVAWRPQTVTMLLLDQVRSILDEYRNNLPLTLRQIFYRLVGAHGYDKDERAYERLCEMLNRARRARIISMDVIRDDGGTVLAPDAWASAGHFLDAVRRQAGGLVLDHTEGQKTRLVVICEAGGMAPQLERVASPFGVTVMSGGGFDGLTDKFNFAERLAGEERPTEVHRRISDPVHL